MNTVAFMPDLHVGLVEERSPSWRTTRGLGIHARLRAYRIGERPYVNTVVSVKTGVDGKRTGDPIPPSRASSRAPGKRERLVIRRRRSSSPRAPDLHRCGSPRPQPHSVAGCAATVFAEGVPSRDQVSVTVRTGLLRRTARSARRSWRGMRCGRTPEDRAPAHQPRRGRHRGSFMPPRGETPVRRRRLPRPLRPWGTDRLPNTRRRSAPVRGPAARGGIPCRASARGRA